MTSPYAVAAAELLESGWAGVLPLPKARKFPPPKGFTGLAGVDPTPEQVQRWVRRRGWGNVALRLPVGVVGLDVDVRHGGLDTLAERVVHLGLLPETWAVTARHDGGGIFLFRVPDGARLAGAAGPGIDVVQHHHRYVVAPPSVHPSGAVYCWVPGDVPRPDDLPSLPESWLRHLARPQRRAA